MVDRFGRTAVHTGGRCIEVAGHRLGDQVSTQLAFWHGVALAGTGREDEARGLLGQAFSAGDGWRELLERLPAAGLLPDDPALVERLGR